MRLPQPSNCHYQPLVLLSASLVAAQWWRWRLQQRAGTEILARAIPMSCTCCGFLTLWSLFCKLLVLPVSQRLPAVDGRATDARGLGSRVR
ncbi:hypothetical protein CFAM422_009943 [Trichoderma lentiforme]|uniref:Uncharacterized protein n=1 Tax=Trichoderma lentiforme TaxID=1567552 RepID=A0A9P4X927_9HYPO|nr:hypothetical protein CFAM422_009943 [Trichoderma lentiforme]